MKVKWVFRCAAFAGGLWLAFAFTPLILTISGIEWRFEHAGQWGDSFGALNALFASLGFGAALYTLISQQEQIARDRFDSSYFELLRLFIEARDRVTFKHSLYYLQKRRGNTSLSGIVRPRSLSQTPPKAEVYTGIDAFQHAWIELRYWVPDLNNTPLKEVVRMYEAKIHRSSENTLGPYFRQLYTLMSRIEQDRNLSNADKAVYGNLVRAHLSQHEASLAGMNGLSKISKDFKDLVKCFRLLKYTTGSRRVFLQQNYPDYTFEGRDSHPQTSFTAEGHKN